MIVEGSLSVKAVLLAKNRDVLEILVDEKKIDKDTNFILAKAYESNVKVTKVKREEIDAQATGKTHGGILAMVSSRNYQQLEDCFDENAFICVLEGVEDPFNLGYALRTLYSAGCTGVLLPNRDWSYSESTILKSSAGASEYIKICLSDDLASDIRQCKKQGYTCFAAMRKDAVSYFDVDYRGPCLLAIGGEMRGLSRNVLEEIEQNIYIPYANDFRNALNASSAVAAISFEIVRQRRKS
ncbi:RNA methyltransferase [Anaerorhabdus sp.]|uniref:TrmH family RNA methyltransferase n=1 Tax=Anaerorhabdus sp. TaxID=1872524 RepID=UPI002B20ACEE|nr:RNA methyltransferase [Anaerorhabdus sp.]MEA4875328.1 RNA methyltransferase [Anaerorhabdus sp.]